MKQVDYIIVGLGIAGMTFCEQLRKAGRSFVVVDQTEPNATGVAGGTINPVVLKRFTPVWMAQEFLDTARAFYQSMEALLDQPFISDRSLVRVMANSEEITTWQKAATKSELSNFLDPTIHTQTPEGLNAPHGVGAVKGSFRIDPAAIKIAYANYLEASGQLLRGPFEHEQIQQTAEGLTYKEYHAKQLVFAEGVGVVDNPYFTINSFIPKKGAYIIVEAPDLKLDQPVKGRFFVIPLGDNRYKVGATFVHGDLSWTPTQQSKDQVKEVLDKLLSVPYKIVEHQVGMRPTVKDRRPLMGSLGQKHIYFFNGLGTRGLLMAPTLCKWLFDYIEQGKPLPDVADISRYA